MKRKKSNERLNVTATTTTRYLKHTLGIIRWMRTTMNRMYACLSCRTVNVRLIISSPCVKSIFIIIFFLFCFFNCGIRLKANVIKFSKHSNWFPSSTCYYYSFIAAILLALCIFICSGFSCHTQMFHFFSSSNETRQTLRLYVINAIVRCISRSFQDTPPKAIRQQAYTHQSGCYAVMLHAKC